MSKLTSTRKLNKSINIQDKFVTKFLFCNMNKLKKLINLTKNIIKMY